MLRLFLVTPLAFAGALLCNAADQNSMRTPVLLELFTSEGCSSCPPADQLLQTLDQKQPVAGAEVIVLSEHVDYWDRLGWKDPFSSPQYTARQKTYTEKYRLDGVYTPQLVVDGRFGVVGSDGSAVSSAIRQALREQKIPITISRTAHDDNQLTAHIDVPAGERNAKDGSAILYAAVADNRMDSQVSRGENSGRSLSHVAVTRVLKQMGTVDLGSPTAKEIVLDLPPGMGRSGSRLVVFLQDPKSGRILGTAAQQFLEKGWGAKERVNKKVGGPLPH
ncbi:MAG: DUF1223 domain-containing protein [Acidobacteriota bacterium]